MSDLRFSLEDSAKRRGDLKHAPGDSWWTRPTSREEFSRMARERDQAMASDRVWRKGEANFDRGLEK